ncbi:MAG TPA: non-ribosomal peptide synthetase [Jiangellales bacterium]|nr:non-ribosomal peptide synthetase [Jiangellales bacterium]
MTQTQTDVTTVAQPSPVAPGEPVPLGRTLVTEFVTAACSVPDRIAVLDNQRSLTFGELDDRTDRLAGLLIAHGAGPERLVGLCLRRSVDLLVAIFGILKAGAAYVPLDPEQPAERLAMIASDARISALVTESDLGKLVAVPDGCPTIELDQIDWAARPRAVPCAVDPDNLAYTIFTSGSTGRPKGVQVAHRSVVNLLDGLEKIGAYGPVGARVGWNATIAFDASVQQWTRVCRGDTVAVLDEESRRDSEAFARFVAEHAVTDVDMTPSHAQVLLPDLEPVIRARGERLRLLIAGEAIPSALWTKLRELIVEGVLEAFNLYGPTEATVDALGTPVVGDAPHIGGPLANVGIRVVDERLNSVPDGTPGELCLTGIGLARGYLNQPGLTAARFVPDPDAADGSRMYRTGDRVLREPDGTVRFLGRVDNQVKIRGYRVELGEIESVLAAHPGVSQAVVVYQDGNLHAFLTPADVDVNAVRARAEQALPTWMQPGGYQALDRLPRTTGGKIDRAALTQLVQGSATPGGVPPAVSSGGSMADLVREVWSEVLDVASIADTDDFFSIGGHSLSAMQVAVRLRDRLGTRVPTRMLFQHRTAGALAAALQERVGQAGTAAP